MTADRVSFCIPVLRAFFDLRTELKYTLYNWISGYEINGVSNIIIFASGSEIGLTFFFDSNNV